MCLEWPLQPEAIDRKRVLTFVTCPRLVQYPKDILYALTCSLTQFFQLLFHCTVFRLMYLRQSIRTVPYHKFPTTIYPDPT
jgi:hypothetical protein